MKELIMMFIGFMVLMLVSVFIFPVSALFRGIFLGVVITISLVLIFVYKLLKNKK